MANHLHSTLSGADLHYSKIQTISGNPISNPTYVGQSIYDSTNKILYVANGISSLANWQIVNSFNLQTGTSYVIVAADNRGIISLSNTGARTITAITAPINGFKFTIKDEAGTAYSANITINAGGADTFDGGGTAYIIDSEYASISFVYDSVNSIWTAE